MKNLRNTHLLEAAARAVVSSNSLNMIGIAREIVDQPAPGYYVDYSRAIRYLKLYQCNKLPVNLSVQKRRMWTEIFQRMEDTIKRHPRLTCKQALARVLCEGGASSFFIEPQSAARIMRQNLKLLKYNLNKMAI
ncbi:MAG: hypothetical protein K2M65_02075 [Muribaculaceae bacterium]|nr:hypothetical protein [Muribaculaceae bacterium]